mmetsp:Transcript_40398/g.88332  ORF Transcript_40398/g.88332 Transcript_40398/m.88332 type:complete len:257 (-) Transcript_40398:1441-2211(-)
MPTETDNGTPSESSATSIVVSTPRLDTNERRRLVRGPCGVDANGRLLTLGWTCCPSDSTPLNSASSSAVEGRSPPKSITESKVGGTCVIVICTSRSLVNFSVESGSNSTRAFAWETSTELQRRRSLRSSFQSKVLALGLADSGKSPASSRSGEVMERFCPLGASLLLLAGCPPASNEPCILGLVIGDARCGLKAWLLPSRRPTTLVSNRAANVEVSTMAVSMPLLEQLAAWLSIRMKTDTGIPQASHSLEFLSLRD